MTNRIDHTTCSHPRTPAGRAACRQQNREWLAAMNPAPVVVPTPNIAADLRKLNAAMAPKTTRRQPTARRGKVAVDDPRTCVQWELHTGTGRCACGWAA